MVADQIFGTRERGMLSRLEVGLADEGLRVARALPESVASEAGLGSLSQAITYDDARVPFTRSIRAARLASAASAVHWTEDEHGGPGRAPPSIDVVHAFGGAIWDFAFDVARRLEASLALEVWRIGLIERSVSLAKRYAGVNLVYLAPDVSIERRLKAAGVEGVRLAPWGVHAFSRSKAAPARDKAISIVISGGGRDSRATLAALEGVSLAIADHPGAVVFMDAVAARRARVWPVAKRLGLLDRLSLIDDIEQRRDLALRADVLIQPEAVGEQRSVLLDAMAAGMVVIAASDPGVAWLIDGETCWLISEHTPRVWAETVSRAIRSPEDAQQLAARAMARVAREHRASAHVAAVIGAYEWVVGGPHTGLDLGCPA